MPIYCVECKKCGKRDEVFRRLADYKNMPDCCGVMMSKYFTPINVQQDIQPYQSMVTGEMITSRSQHRAHLKQHGCIEIGNENPIPKPKSESQRRYEKEENIKYLHDIYEQKLRHGDRLELPNRNLNESDTVII